MPAVSKAQYGMAAAACKGKARRKISKAVACEMMHKTHDVASLPKRRGKR